MLVHISIPTPYGDACQQNYITSWFRGWTADAAFTHMRGLFFDQRPPPKERRPPLEKKNGLKFF